MGRVFKEHVDRSGRPFTIREAEERDAEAVLLYMTTLLAETDFHLQMPDELRLGVRDEQYYLRRMNATPNSVFLVAERQHGVIVGSLCFTGGSFRRTQHSGELGMGVLQEHWRLGVGRALMEDLIDWARGSGVVTRITLRVFENNTRAIKLYESMGFVLEGSLRDDVIVDGQPIDLLVMGRKVRLP